MFTIKLLRIHGFRGFLDEQEFRFDTPVVILFGENRSGKSSTLNALEWCLFGDECVGAKTAIRERVGWVIPNRHRRASDVGVELHLESADGLHIIRRRLSRPTKRKAEGTLELLLPDGEMLAGARAEHQLDRLRRSSFRDFMATVYQHQEVVRGIVTLEPRDRNDAIDRLLGLSDYRNLLTGIRSANPAGRLKKTDEKFTQLAVRLTAVLDAWEKELVLRRRQAMEAGLPADRLSEKQALAAAADVRQALTGFAAEAGLEPAGLEVPADGKGLAGFEKSARKAISRLRSELPLAREHEEWFARQKDALRLRAELEDTRRQQETLAESIRRLDQEHGGRQAVEDQLRRAGAELEAEKSRLRQANRQAALIREAIGYLEQAGSDQPAELCPVCAGPAPDLLESLRARQEQALQAQFSEIGRQIQQLEGRLPALAAAADQYRKAEEKQAVLAREASVCRVRVGQMLGRGLTDADDLPALLGAEGERVEQRLKQLADAVRAKQQRLDQIEEKLEQVRVVGEIMQAEERKKAVEKLHESPEYRELESARGRLAELVADVESVRDAVSAAANEEARHKVAAAGSAIDDYFRQLTRHPAVPQIRLNVEADSRSGRNEYSVTDANGSDLAPVLSQGDLNALALAIFLGLAASSADAGPFGFVLLDDPSQSLGSAHKEQLARVLDRVAGSRQVVLATMDREFRDCLHAALTRPLTEYRFEPWTPQTGIRARRA